MQSIAKDVKSYIAEAPAERREALTKLRELCVKTLKGFDESIEYEGPCYSCKGVVEAGFASQKNYISLYSLRQDALETQRAFLTGLNVGKGCIRYSKPGKFNFAVVKKMLAATREGGLPNCV